jgi:hypothetical protein
MKTLLKTILPILAVTLLLGQNLQAKDNHMQEAIEALRNARAHLEAATADKGGHRVRAIRAIDNAIAEVKAGIQYDRDNESRKEEKRKERKEN